jgi:hypothetical protein
MESQGELRTIAIEKRNASLLPASEQGTMEFMSVEVAAQRFLFAPPDLGFSSSEVGGFLSAAKQDVGTAEIEVPFSHNHLHDLESLWWVAVWVVFYNYFSEGTPSHDSPSFTLRDAGDQLNLGRILSPPVLQSTDHPTWRPLMERTGDHHHIIRGRTHPRIFAQGLLDSTKG